MKTKSLEKGVKQCEGGLKVSKAMLCYCGLHAPCNTILRGKNSLVTCYINFLIIYYY